MSRFLSTVLPFQNVIYVESNHMQPFYIWLLSLSIMLLRFIHVVACISNLFLFATQHSSTVWIYYSLPICPLMDVWVVSRF